MTVKHQELGVGREGEVIPLVWSAELETICRLKMSKTANFDTLSIKTFYVQGLFQDFAQEGANALCQISRGGKSKS